jgi:hypothetical protein
MTTTPAPTRRFTGCVRPQGRRSRTLTSALLLATALTLTGCTPSASTPPTTSEKTTVADPNTVLNQLAAELRTQVDALTAGLRTTDRGTTGNKGMVCGAPSHDEWPKQWDYSQQLYLTETDSRPTARKLADELRAKGWTIRIDRDDSTDLQITAQHQGAVIYIAGGSTGGGMAVNGASACVNADGTVDHRVLN